MIEKSITLEGIPLVDFLGIENQHISALSAGLPESKIIARGNKITIWGDTKSVVKATDVLNSMIHHFHRFGHITEENITHYLTRETPVRYEENPQHTLLLHSRQGIPIKTRTTNQQKLVSAVKNHNLIFVTGPAGTGKTYISVALAVSALKKKEIQKIVITRPVVEAGERLGFLPGDLKAKIDPYLRPIYDVLQDLMSVEKMEYYMEREIIEVAPLAYMRGRTLNNAFILLDEAQNTTLMQMKMALTRMGPSSRMVVTGDTSQVDLPLNQYSGLQTAIEKLQGIKEIAFVTLTDRDVVRHPLVRKIIKAYQQ